MRTLPLLLILIAVGAFVWLLHSQGEGGAPRAVPDVAGDDRDGAEPEPPLLREERLLGSGEPLGLYRPDAPEARGPATLPPGVLIRLPARRTGARLTGREVLDAVARVVPVRGRTEDDLRALQNLAMDEGWGERPDPVPLEEILTLWGARGIDVRPQGRVLVVAERRHADPRAVGGR